MRALSFGALLLVLASPALAAWTNLSHINTTVCDAVNDQVAPAAIPDGSGGAFVVWRDTRVNNEDVYAQRLNARGERLWATSGVAMCTNTSSQGYPILCPDGAGGVIIAWQDSRNGNYDIYAQRLNGSGIPQWMANGVPVVVYTLSQQYPVIHEDGQGGAYVIWRDNRNANYDLFAQRLTSSGGQAWTSGGLEVSGASGDQYSPLLTLDAYGSAVAVWTDQRAGNADVYAQRFGPSAAFAWADNGVAVCTAADAQWPNAIETDGTYTTYVVWTDLRDYATNNYDIYAQAIRLTGSSVWASNGAPVCVNTSQQREPTLVVDPAGGVFVAWNDTRSGSRNDLYGQRLTSGGSPLWTTDGIALITTGGPYRQYPVGASDGAGGFVLGWWDTRGSTVWYDLMAQRFNSSGTAQWTSGGVGLLTNAATTYEACFVPDGSGGLIGFASEARSAGTDLFAQRVDHYGYLGLTEPMITAVKDVPADQGGQVKLSFHGSYQEDEPWLAVSSYRVYRSVSPQALASRTRPAALTRDPDAVAADPAGTLYVTSTATGDYYWEYVTAVTVDYLGDYSVLAATAYDSTSLGNPRTAFMVQARSGSKHWDSWPDSGYSVDNLAPLAPAPFTGQYAAGAATLHWNPNAETDLAGYRLYRGSSVSFVPGPGNLVAALPDTGYADAAGAPFYYKLTAVDVHGNESAASLLLPAGALGVGDDPPGVLALARPWPNPVTGPATVAFTLPATGHATLSLHDVAGRRVALLADGAFEPGEHRVAFEPGVRGGLFWLRLETAWGVRTQRIAVLR